MKVSDHVFEEKCQYESTTLLKDLFVVRAGNSNLPKLVLIVYKVVR